MKNIYGWFNSAFDALKERNKIIGKKVKCVKQEKCILHDSFKRGKVDLSTFTKKQASFNRQLSKLRVSARNINAARLLLAGKIDKAFLANNTKVNWFSVLDIIASTMGLELYQSLKTAKIFQ